MDTVAERIRTAYWNLDRRKFLEENLDLAEYDGPLPIGYGQTISQPSLVLAMTLELELFDNCTILEIGTGSGYQTALLSVVASKVYTVERIDPLYHKAKDRLERLGYSNIEFLLGDGWLGWPENGPYDRIIVTAAAPMIPGALLDQLAPGGVMILPLGPDGAVQELCRIRRTADGKYEEEVLERVRFVPMVHGVEIEN